jgi:hypothetical protein
MENRRTQTRHSECTRRAAFGRVKLTFHDTRPGTRMPKVVYLSRDWNPIRTAYKTSTPGQMFEDEFRCILSVQFESNVESGIRATRASYHLVEVNTDTFLGKHH